MPETTRAARPSPSRTPSAVLCIALAWTATRAAYAGPCEPLKPDALLAYDTQRRAYLKTLETSPDDRCAQEGLEVLHSRRVSAFAHLLEGRSWAARNQPWKAREAYLRALDADPGFGEAADALAAQLRPTPMPSAPPGPYARAGALFDAGLDSAAKVALDEALKTTTAPLPPEIVAALKRTRERKARAAAKLGALGLHDKAQAQLEEQIKEDPDADVGADHPYLAWGWLDGARRWRDLIVRSFLVPLGDLASALLALFALALAVRYAYRVRSRKPPLVIGEFGPAAGLGIDVSREMPVLLQEKLMSLRSDAGVVDLNVVSGPAQPLSLPAEVLSVVPAAGVVASLLKLVPSLPRLLGQRPLELSGHLHGSTDGQGDTGITLVLKRGGELVGTRTLWRKDFQIRDAAGPATYYRLAELAAIWVQFAARQRTDEPGFEVLGTRDWLSYAFFRAGYFAHVDPARPSHEAAQLYLKALSRDQRNRGAKVNFASIILRSRPEDALVLLDDVLANAPEGETSAFIAQYRKLLALHELGRNGDATTAAHKLVALVRLRQDALKEPDGKDKAAATTLRGALLLAQSTLPAVAEVETAGAGAAHAGGIDLTTAPAAVLFNLACYHSIAAAHQAGAPAAHPAPPPPSHVENALALLRRSLELKPGFAAQAAKDRSFAFLRGQAATKARFETLVDEFTKKPAPPAGVPPVAPAAAAVAAGNLAPGAV